jgi:hypothetical protein
MKALTTTILCLLLVALTLPAGSQQGPQIVRPRVQVHTGVVQPVEAPPGIEPFGTTLLLRFWTTRGDKENLAIELRCAAPPFRAALSRAALDEANLLEIEGEIQLLRDGEILLLFDAKVGAQEKGPDQAFEAAGSVMLREGAARVLVSTGDTALHARFTLDVEE